MLSKRFGRILTLLLVLGLCRLASAHPMGNFSVNHYSKIDVQGDRIIVRYFIDLAEIPTYQELQQGNIVATTDRSEFPGSYPLCGRTRGRPGTRSRSRCRRQTDSATAGLERSHLSSRRGWSSHDEDGFCLRSSLPIEPIDHDRQHVGLHYADNNYPGHSGWKEIVALASAGSLLRSSVPATDRSGELSNYPTDLLTSPPQDLEAS